MLRAVQVVGDNEGISELASVHDNMGLNGADHPVKWSKHHRHSSWSGRHHKNTTYRNVSLAGSVPVVRLFDEPKV